MKLGAAAWGFRETPLEQQLQILRELGLASLELGIAGHENDRLQADASAAEAAKVVRLYHAHGVALEAAATGNDFTQPQPHECFESLRKVERVLAVAGTLGVKYLRIFAGFSRAEEVTGERWRIMVSCLTRANEAARRKGVTLAIETHGGVEAKPNGVRHYHSASSRPDLLELLLAEIPAEIGLVFDPANLGAVGMNTMQIVSLYRQLRNRICYMHLKDFRAMSGGTLSPCACGEGELDWELLMREFSDFAGIGFIEYELPGDVVEGLGRSLQVLRMNHDGCIQHGIGASAIDMAL